MWGGVWGGLGGGGGGGCFFFFFNDTATTEIYTLSLHDALPILFGFDEISAFTHEVETIFDRIRDGKLKVNKELIDLTLAAGDQVKKMFGSSASSAGTKENAEKLIESDPVVVINGDSYCSINMSQFVDFHVRKQALLTMVVAESEKPKDVGLISLDSQHKVVRFEEKKKTNEKAYINAGIYLFEKSVFSRIPSRTNYSLEYDLFPKLVGQEFYGFTTREKLIDIGTPESYEEAKRFFSK